MDFLNVLKKNKDIRKVFGRREIIIIEKQLLGITLRPSEKTRLSRDIRKKLDAIKMLIPFVDDFELKHGAIIKEKIKRAQEIILGSEYFPRIKRIILFGSVVERQLSFRSDIDIAVEFDIITEKEAFKFRLDILRDILDRMDIQVYNVLPGKIKKEIDKKGRVLYERKGQR